MLLSAPERGKLFDVDFVFLDLFWFESASNRSPLSRASVHDFPSRLLPVYFFLYILASVIIALCIPQRLAFRSTTIVPSQLCIDSWTRYRPDWFAPERFEFEFVSAVLSLIMDMDMMDLLSLSCSLLKIGFLPVNEYGRLVSAHRVDNSTAFIDRLWHLRIALKA